MSFLNQNSGNTISGSTISSGTTINNYTFLDQSGNVTQISKITKSREKYYIDPDISYSHCVIGVDDESNGLCSEGTALGFGNSNIAEIYYTDTNKSRKKL